MLEYSDTTHSSRQIGKKGKYYFRLVLYTTKFVDNFNGRNCCV